MVPSVFACYRSYLLVFSNIPVSLALLHSFQRLYYASKKVTEMFYTIVFCIFCYYSTSFRSLALEKDENGIVSYPFLGRPIPCQSQAGVDHAVGCRKVVGISALRLQLLCKATSFSSSALFLLASTGISPLAVFFGSYISRLHPPYKQRHPQTADKMDLESIRKKVENLTLYDLKAGVRQVQNGKRPNGEEKTEANLEQPS